MKTLSLDVSLFQAIHSPDCHDSWWASFNLIVTEGSIWIWLAFALILGALRGKKYFYAAFFCVIGLLVAWLITDEFLKPLFARERPFLELETCVIGHRSSSFSFPSGHTTTSFCIATLIHLYHRPKLIVSILSFGFAAFVAYTRIYLGVHFPSDILAGAVCGMGVGYVLYKMFDLCARHCYDQEKVNT